LPTRIRRHATSVLIICAPIAIGLLTWTAWDAMTPRRPVLVLMIFMSLLGTCMVAAVVMLSASMHLAVSRAFAAGVQVGRDNPAPTRRQLRAVE
jgi:hypothetical protein